MDRGCGETERGRASEIVRPFITVERSASREAFEEFRTACKEGYEGLGAGCKTLTRSEPVIGYFGVSP